MSKVKMSILAAGTALLTLASCAKQHQCETIKQICVPQATKADAIKSAENVLGRMHFSIDKADAEQGHIKTRPLPAAQFFEFWRSDVVGNRNSAEANIHNIRRIAELDIKQQDQQLCISCNVKVQRLSLSEPKGSDAALMLDRFQSSGTPTLEKKMKIRTGQKTWIELGDDELLETKILKRLEKQITKKDKKT